MSSRSVPATSFEGTCGNCETTMTLVLEPEHEEQVAAGLQSIELRCICGDKVIVRRRLPEEA